MFGTVSRLVVCLNYRNILLAMLFQNNTHIFNLSELATDAKNICTAEFNP
jgi:hypothetical protein